ncbi:MAG: histidinol-phosphate transaminase [Clostridia bacterium]|nr:histidinol-phosphate transaminase [Clostridia bacterium]
MSRFFSDKYAELKAYVPGEQPKKQQYIKLNTNENPFPPHPAVVKAAREAAGKLELYPEPECTELRETLAGRLGVSPDELIMTNGSDEILNFAFMAFCDRHIPAVFADITYGFYPVYGQINLVPYREIPLQEDLTIRIKDYFQSAGTIFIANPNAPTGIALRRDEIAEILQQNPYNVVVVDEAYVDFGAESCVPLIREYDNLLVTQTFSKSRSMAGARLGFGVANPEIIRDLKTIQYSTNPYNIDRMTMATGIACLQNDEYNMENCRTIMTTRERTRDALEKLGFEVTPSKTNFLFARHPDISGEELYLKLKERGILIRHFSVERIKDYNRITIGSQEDMETVVRVIGELVASDK